MLQKSVENENICRGPIARKCLSCYRQMIYKIPFFFLKTQKEGTKFRNPDKKVLQLESI